MCLSKDLNKIILPLSKYKCPCSEYKQSGLKRNEVQNIILNIMQIHCDQKTKAGKEIHGISTKGIDTWINFFQVLDLCLQDFCNLQNEL